MIRLDRVLSNSGFGSRTDVRRLIRAGRVKVDGATIDDPAFALADDAPGVISLDDQPVTVRRYIHLMLHKPAGLITALHDPRLPTIADLIPENLRNSSLTPVGRLDRDTTGMLLLTNDGTLNHRLASPRWGIWKTYHLTYSGCPLTEASCRQFAAGLQLPDGERCKPAVLLLHADNKAELKIHEGKYHQVKRMIRATGREVLALHRTALGPLSLDSRLQPGQIRLLTQQEAAALYQSVALQPL